MNKKLITLLLLCSLIIPVGMTGCLDEDYDEPVQETTEAAEAPTEETAAPTEDGTESTEEETSPTEGETEPTEEETAPTEEGTEPAEPSQEEPEYLYGTGLKVSSGAVDYEHYITEFYTGETYFAFTFEFLGNPLAGGKTEYDEDVEAAFEADWETFAADFILTVDGTEYTSTGVDLSYCDTDGEVFEAGTCCTGVYFPGIDYDNAETITLTVGEDVYTLKDGDQFDYGKLIKSEAYEIALSSGNVDYVLTGMDYYEKCTILWADFDFTESPLANGETDYHNYDQLEEAFDADWEAYTKDFVLTVDGTAYPIDECHGTMCYQEGDSAWIEPGTCSAVVLFPGIDYKNAETITLTAGGEVYTLKEPKDYNGAKPWLFSNCDGVVTEDTPAELKDDFYLYVNKDDHVSLVCTDEDPQHGFVDSVEESQKERFEKMFSNPAPEDHDAKLAYDLYHLATDWDARNAVGVQPLMEKIEAVEAIDSVDALTDYLGTSGENNLWNSFADTDLEDPDNYIIVFYPFNTLISDPAEYANMTPEGEDELGAAQYFAVEMLKKCGFTEDEAWDKVENRMSLETTLAETMLTAEEQEQYEFFQEMGDHVSREELIELSGQLPLLTDLEQTWNFPEFDTYIVVEPEFFEKLNALCTEDNLTLLKDYLIVNLMFDYAEDLDYETVKLYNESFANGMPEDDAAYGQDIVSSNLAWPFEKLYSLTALKQEDKERLTNLTDEIISNYREILNNEDFISEETRSRAIEKLDALGKNILYPDDWSKYNCESLNIRSAEEGGSFFEAEEQILKFNIAQMAEVLRNPMEDPGWDPANGFAPHVENCFYSPGINEIFILGGWTQGVSYYPDMTVEELYATMGYTIGHEISHAFDKEGAMYDKDGNEENWWTDEDLAAFQERNGKLIEYFSTQVEPWADAHLDGEFLAAEACADMGGMKVMLLMASKIPDFDYDLFFRTYASSNMIEYNESIAYWCYTDDKHPFDYLRVNVVLQQFDEFLDFYGITEGDGMYLAPEDRILVW
ncbi:MAG: M13 family metallopeptidase [Oscillospiraceae bacterium]|nr:M13 family metallopeptidase [Oscillospiraceae bacterium]